jgi:branched-subunit amino acid permease
MSTAINRVRTIGSANVAVWVTQILLAAIFLGASSGELVGRPTCLPCSTRSALGNGFRYVTGTLVLEATIMTNDGLITARSTYSVGEIMDRLAAAVQAVGLSVFAS